MTESAGLEGIAYTRLGSGPPLVLIHGLGGTRLVWEPQLERLAEQREVIAIDLPGFGESASLTEPATAAAMAARVLHFLSDLGIERPHVAGNSLGGWVALEMARQGELASLCLISPAGLWRRRLGPRSFDARAAAQRLRPVIIAALRHPGTRQRMLGGTVGRPDLLTLDTAKRLVNAWIDAPGYEAANREMRAGLFERPEEIDVPTTIVWGELDRLVGPPKPGRRPPNSRMIVVPHVGHTPNWDDPELIAELLLEASSGDSEVAVGDEPGLERALD